MKKKEDAGRKTGGDDRRAVIRAVKRAVNPGDRGDKVLVIYAHPDTGGHCSSILESIEAKLGSKKLPYEVIDLYGIGYDPVLHENEHYTRGGKEVSEENRLFQQKIHQSRRLIFIYPVWWATMPAILKGFFDRVLVSGYAFRYDNGLPVGLLKGRKAAVFITSGAKTWLSQVFQGGRPRKVIARDILAFCGIRSRVFQIGGATRLDAKNEEKIKKAVKTGLGYLMG